MNKSLVVALGHVKGGVGKTTLAVNLAISQALSEKDVLLVDGDEQGTARAFTQLRADVLGAPGYAAVSLRGAEIRTQVRLLRPKYEYIVVDVGGRDTASLRAALTVADMLIVPVLPATFDVWSLEPLGDLIQEAREINGELTVLAVLNAADPQGRDNEEAAAIIRESPASSISPTRSFGAKRSAMLLRRVCPYRSAALRTRKRSMNLHFLRIMFSDTLAISPPSLMAIAKHPIRKTKTKDKQAEKFIMAASKPTPEADTEGRFIQTPIRFPKTCWSGSTEQLKEGV